MSDDESSGSGGLGGSSGPDVGDGWVAVAGNGDLSNGDLMTDVGERGLVHGPWGNDVTSVEKTFEFGGSGGSCEISWISFGLNSRDNEWERVFVNDVEVWGQQISPDYGNPETANWLDSDPGVGNIRMYEVSVTVDDCGPTVVLRFDSAIDQALSDEGWAFSSVSILPDWGVGAPRCCLVNMCARVHDA